MAAENFESSSEERLPIEHLVERFDCPIMMAMMEDPVVAADGHTYERAAIVDWIKGGRGTSPLTGERLAHFELTPNHLLRALISDYRELHPRVRTRILNEENIKTAIALREQDLTALMAKHAAKLAQASAEKAAIEQRLGPLASRNTQLAKTIEGQVNEIESLRTECQALHDRNAALNQKISHLTEIEAEKSAALTQAETRLTQLTLALGGGQEGRVDLPVDDNLKKHLVRINQLELSAAEIRRERAANVIKRNIGQVGLHKRLKESQLHEAKDNLLKQKLELAAEKESAINKIQKRIQAATENQDWKAISTLSEEAHEINRQCDHSLAALDANLDALEQAREEKQGLVTVCVKRLKRINENKNAQDAAMNEVINTQAQEAVRLSDYLQTRRSSEAPAGEIDDQMGAPGGEGELSPVSAASSEGVTFFKPASAELTPAQIVLQDELITACEKGQVDKVKALIAQGADLYAENGAGKLPLGAAIWGCNPQLVEFLQTQMPNLDAGAWQRCAQTNVCIYGSLVPEVKPFDECCKTYGDWYDFFSAHGGEGVGIYSEWYSALADGRGDGVTCVRNLRKVRGMLEVTLYMRNVRMGGIGQVGKWGYFNTRLSLDYNKQWVQSSRVQHEGYRAYIRAMAELVEAKSEAVACQTRRI